MNVLQVNTVYPNGSTGRITAAIATYTAAQPHTRAMVAFGVGEEVRADSLCALRIGTPWERKIHGAKRKLFDAEGYGSRRATRKLIRLCENTNVDVVHLHNLHGCYIHLKSWFGYLQKANIPVVWTLHDCWAVTGHCAHFDFCGCMQWKTLCRSCPQKHEYPECIGFSGSKRNYRMKERLFTSLPKLTLAAPSQWIQTITAQSYLQKYPARVVYNGVDTKVFQPTESDIRVKHHINGKKLLLFVASEWTERKGLLVIADLANRLDNTYQLAVVGLKEAQIKDLPHNVLGVEHLSSAHDLCAWYTAADCFVNPTLEDTMPLVNLEALACGTPIAVFRTGGCPEVVTDACGMVVPKNDANALAEAVQLICAKPKTSYHKACIEQAARFSMDKTIQSYYQLYQEVMQ